MVYTTNLLLIDNFYLNDFAVLSYTYYPAEQLFRQGITYRGVLLENLPADAVASFANLVNQTPYDAVGTKLFFKEYHTLILSTLETNQLPVPPIFKEICAEVSIANKPSNVAPEVNTLWSYVLAQRIVKRVLGYAIPLNWATVLFVLLTTALVIIACVQILLIIYERITIFQTLKTIWTETKRDMDTRLTFENTYFFSFCTIKSRLTVRQYIHEEFVNTARGLSIQRVQITVVIFSVGGATIQHQIRQRYLD